MSAVPLSVMAVSEQKTEVPASAFTTVQELLQLESRVALEAARKKVFGAASGSASTTPADDRPVLHAIYGTGRNLSAEVMIEGRLVIFNVVGKNINPGLTKGYGLERILPPCIYLTKDQTQQITCLEKTAP